MIAPVLEVLQQYSVPKTAHNFGLIWAAQNLSGKQKYLREKSTDQFCVLLIFNKSCSVNHC